MCEKEATVAAEQVVCAAAKKLAARATVVGMGGGTRDLAGAVRGGGAPRASAYVLLAKSDECTGCWAFRVLWCVLISCRLQVGTSDFLSRFQVAKKGPPDLLSKPACLTLIGRKAPHADSR